MGSIVGRERELEAIAAFLDLDGGASRVLLVEGEAGIGKTTVWTAAAKAAAEQGYRVLLSQPVEVESGLSFAAAGDLLAGVLAPALRLPSLDGEPVTIGELGQETVVLFWNPGCGFCSSMRDDLLAWERHAPADAPRLLIVSSGDEVSTRAEGFSSTVALDVDFSVGAAFDAGGTPMAVLLDREGRVASPLAAGGEAVFALAGGHGLVDSRADMGVAVKGRQ